MNRIITSRLGALLAGSVALVGAVAVPPAAADDATGERRGGSSISGFGFRGDVYGVKLVTDSVEALDVKDAHAQLVCTRQVGRSVERQSVVTIPDNPLVDVSLSSSRTETYRSGATRGVRGVNTIGDVSIGGTVGPLTTPKLVIKGLRTTADAHKGPQGYGHAEDFTFASISLDLVDNTIVDNLPPELVELLAPLDPVTDTLFTGTEEVATQIFKILQSATEPIDIPGLGSISLGYRKGSAGARSAQSQASALRIHLTAGERRQLVELGTARVRMGGPAPAGVFRSGGTAMDYQALQGNLRFGNVHRKAVPCEGTHGRTQTYRVKHASQLLPVPVVLGEVAYRLNGRQIKRKKIARGWASTSIGSVSVPIAQLEIKDLVTKVTTRGRLGNRVRSRVTTSIGSITAGGTPLAVPAPGGSVELPGGMGVIERQVVSNGYSGAHAIGLRVKLFDQAVVIDLARTTGRIHPR